MAQSNSISRMALKAVGLFGGVQVAGILCAIIRTKLVALLIGPVGVGLFSLFNQAMETINTASGLGIRQSSVRDLSLAQEQGQESLIARMVAAVRRWSLWLGLLGATLTLMLAPQLSQWTFGNDSQVWGFIVLSIAILLVTLTNGEYAILQGMAQLKRLAHVTILGAVFGLVVSIPLFYYLRENSILPSIIAYASGNALFAYLFRHRNYASTKSNMSDSWQLGKGFVKLGIYMTIGNFVTILAGYAFNAWLNMNESTHEVGLYQAGYTLVYKYTGLILTALGMEYYPRLSKVIHSKIRLQAYVSQEINIVMMLMAPVAALFMIFRELIVWLLYTSDFYAITTFASWIMVGTIFRALSWCIAFVILAKGDGKIYLITESLSAVVELVINITFYQLWGLNGLGFSFVVWYIVYTAIVWVVYRRTYGLKLIPSCLLNMAWALAVSLLTLAAVQLRWQAVAIAIATTSLIVCVMQLKRQFWGHKPNRQSN